MGWELRHVSLPQPLHVDGRPLRAGRTDGAKTLETRRHRVEAPRVVAAVRPARHEGHVGVGVTLGLPKFHQTGHSDGLVMVAVQAEAGGVGETKGGGDRGVAAGGLLLCRTASVPHHGTDTAIHGAKEHLHPVTRLGGGAGPFWRALGRGDGGVGGRRPGSARRH